MTLSKPIAALLLAASGNAFAAPAAYLMIDHSTAAVMDKATALAVWREQLPPKKAQRLFKLYPAARWGFVSQVEGGFNADKFCVVTARVMLMPRSGKNLQFRPDKTATAFDARPQATEEQCRALARDKLGDAIESVLSSLMAS